MEPMFKELQVINLAQTSGPSGAFDDGYRCDSCEKEFGVEIVTGSVLVCDVLEGYAICRGCQNLGPHNPLSGAIYCNFHSGDCAPFLLDKGWYYNKEWKTVACLVHLEDANAETKEEENAKYQMITNPSDFFRTISASQRFYLSKNGAVYDQPVDTMVTLKLPKVLSKVPSSKIVQLFSEWFRRPEPERWLWSSLLRIDGQRIIDNNLFTFQKYGSLRGWIPFDSVGRHVAPFSGGDANFFPACYYFLVYCDSSNQTLFGQVMLAVVTHNVNEYLLEVRGTNINVERYLELKHELFSLLESIFVFLPTSLVCIIADYCRDDLDFAQRICKLVGHKKCNNKFY